MKKVFHLPILLGCVFFLFTACPNEPDESDDGLSLGSVTAIENQTPEYYSLSSGEKVDADKITSADWDIAFSFGRMIYTNSGATEAALGSGGQGGVWATGKTDFAAVSSPDGADFSLPYAADTERYTSPAAEMGEPVLNRLNVISYAGYGKGSGDTVEDPLTDYKYNAKQYYSANLSTMPPVYSMTNQVYIIKHGDGVHYSKLQIRSMDSLASTRGNRRVYLVKYRNF
jgi:hypothetical protein